MKAVILVLTLSVLLAAAVVPVSAADFEVPTPDGPIACQVNFWPDVPNIGYLFLVQCQAKKDGKPLAGATFSFDEHEWGKISISTYNEMTCTNASGIYVCWMTVVFVSGKDQIHLDVTVNGHGPALVKFPVSHRLPKTDQTWLSVGGGGFSQVGEGAQVIVYGDFQTKGNTLTMHSDSAMGLGGIVSCAPWSLPQPGQHAGITNSGLETLSCRIRYEPEDGGILPSHVLVTKMASPTVRASYIFTVEGGGSVSAHARAVASAIAINNGDAEARLKTAEGETGTLADAREDWFSAQKKECVRSSDTHKTTKLEGWTSASVSSSTPSESAQVIGQAETMLDSDQEIRVEPYKPGAEEASVP